MTQLTYTEQQLMRSHEYARPQVVAGHRLHGGFDATGRYIPPRLLFREPAVRAWTEALRARGGDLLPADSSLLHGVRLPNEAQLKLLMQEGLEQTFWNTLTITGMIEGRGRVLADMTFPEIQGIVEEDVTDMAVGHLNKGLLRAHGLDEGGEPDKGIGGHDVMWFALRDLAFGERDFPQPQVPERIGRPEAASGEQSGISRSHEQLILFLLNLLMIEFRAEIGFSFTERMLRDPDLFTGRRAQAEEAAEIVNRIRTDEAIHVASLRLYLGELRGLTFRTTSGGRKSGADIIDPLWQRVVDWATIEQPKLQAEQQRRTLTERILAHPDGERLLEKFDALASAD